MIGEINMEDVKLTEIETKVVSKPEDAYIYKFEVMGVAPSAGYTTVFFSDLKDDEERKEYVVKVIGEFINKILEQEQNGRRFIPDNQVVTDRLGFIRENYKLTCYLDSDGFIEDVKAAIFK